MVPKPWLLSAVKCLTRKPVGHRDGRHAIGRAHSAAGRGRIAQGQEQVVVAIGGRAVVTESALISERRALGKGGIHDGEKAAHSSCEEDFGFIFG